LAQDEFTKVLGAWEGYRVVDCQRVEAEPNERRKCAVVMIEPDPGRVERCDGYREEVSRVHDVAVRRICELPILDEQTHLIVPRCRLDCPRCGPTLERLDWLARYARVTGRPAENVVRLCKVLPVRDVVAMDMNWVYQDEVRAQCPGPAVVYDLFHVVAKYGREVIDRVWVDEANGSAATRQPAIW
jgi:transposase